jgi:Bacterial virulence protein (VirJ)
MNYRMWIVALAWMCRVATVLADEPQAPTITIPLRRGAFPTYHFVPASQPKTIIIFGSGDGGWSQIENRVSTFLQKNAFYTVGIDFRKYAATDYDPDILVSDFAVVAAVAAIAIPYSAWFHPAFPVSLLEIHGTSDPVVPYRGGRITDDGGEVLSVEATAELWAKTDRCSRDYVEIPVPHRTAQNDCYPQCFEWSQGEDGTDVVLYRIIAGGHTWPGNPPGLFSSFFLGKVCLDFDASELIWKFFRDHPRIQRSQASHESGKS